MPDRLIPPPELAPGPQNSASPTERIIAWRDLMDTCEQFLLAGLRHKIGPDGDLRLAYRDWYQRQCEDKDRSILARHQRSSGDGELDAL